jgi:hypothetical protein
MIAKVIHTAYILVHAKTIISQQEEKKLIYQKRKVLYLEKHASLIIWVETIKIYKPNILHSNTTTYRVAYNIY